MTLCTVAHQVPLSIELSRQEYWSGETVPSPGDLPDLGIEPGSPALHIDTLPSEPPGKPNPKLLIYSTSPFFFGNRKFVFCVCESVSVL